MAVSLSVSTLGLVIYHLTGELILDKKDLMSVLTRRGFQATWLLPISAYLIIVNACLEELFWRGVVLNELEYLNKKIRLAGTIWTAVTFAAWHYLVFRALLRPIWAEVSIIALVLLAALLSWLYRKTQSIVLPILWHALVLDLAVIVVFVALVYGS